ncbi:uncharacterized protein LOC143876352 [Tasmannia lanceolata]|uniref:uncharacterized protein LOC143876352 n=1 Tax=Tasmannia lanceolata TaxID=3420 RepID=UPI004062986B
MTGFSNLGIGLTTLFTFITLALIAELCYVLCWRKKSRRESAGTDELSGESYNNPSKELLYFFCWKTQSQVKPAGAPAIADTEQSLPLEPKWHDLCGPTRVLFTIKEEREESDSEEGKSSKFEGKYPNESFGDLEKEISFFTPCSSPPFYTPTSSPSRTDEINIAGVLMGSPEKSSDSFSFCVSVAGD